MKLNKENNKIKILLINVFIIILVVLYKTFIIPNKEEFLFTNDNFVDFAFYNGNEKINEMPLKDNADNLTFSYATCDNGAYVQWNENEWAPLVKNLSKSKTKCSLYFDQKINAIEYVKSIAKNSNEDLAYDGKESLGEELGTDDNNLRYIGANPNNYIEFNNEIWRIIGVMKVKNGNNNIEERLKIIRQDGIKGQEDFGRYSWDYNNINLWTTSSLKAMLNGIYYNSSKGDCYTVDDYSPGVKETCDFSQNGRLKGISFDYQKLIDKEVIWNIGAWNEAENTKFSDIYRYERGNVSYQNEQPVEWTKENDSEYHNGIGLMYPSDYGYAVGGNDRTLCLKKNLYINDYSDDNCKENDWLYGSINNKQWLMTSNSANREYTFILLSEGRVSNWYHNCCVAVNISPVVYIVNSAKIIEDLRSNYGSIDNPFRLSN